MLYTVMVGWGWWGVGDYNSPTPGLISLLPLTAAPPTQAHVRRERMESWKRWRHALHCWEQWQEYSKVNSSIQIYYEGVEDKK